MILEYAKDLIDMPEEYLISLPPDAEKEVYCSKCRKMFLDSSYGSHVRCPNCGKEMLRFSEFIAEVAL